MNSLVEQWAAARAAGDDRTALDRGLHLVQAGGCPVAIWLTLPGSWQRLRRMEDMDDFLDSLATRPGTRGGERALLVVAAGRLHPVALATTEAHPPELLLLASALGALARGAPAEAARRLTLCAPARRVPDVLDQVVRVETALAARFVAGTSADSPAHVDVPWPLVAPPFGPPPPLVERIAQTMRSRAEGLRRRGRLLPALGLVEEALLLGEGPGRLSLLQLAAELHLQLAEPARARARLEEALALTPPGPDLARFRRTLASAWLEEDQPGRAEELARELLAGDGCREDPYVLLVLGIALAAQERLDEATVVLRQALAAVTSSPAERAEVTAASLHWLGVVTALQGGHAEAEALLGRALASHPAPAGHPDLAATLTALGTSLAALGRHDEATRRYREALLSFEQSLGSEHPRTLLAASCLTELDTWVDALALERSLAQGSLDDLAVRDQLRRFSGYVVLESPSTRGLLTVAHGGLTRGAVVFTAPDLAEAFLAQTPDVSRMDLRYTSIPGTALASHLRRHGADGAVLTGQGTACAVPLACWEPPPSAR